MMAGTGVSVGGAGMLRTRRRDISIKPNRKLDRKSSRGMIYENEELRLRTIHINAEVEQGQNDIKKLRKENEQLRREIWCLRDEYEKLEKMLKMQKSHGDGDELEVSCIDGHSQEDEVLRLGNSDQNKEQYDDNDLAAERENNYVYDYEEEGGADNNNVCVVDDNDDYNNIYGDYDDNDATNNENNENGGDDDDTVNNATASLNLIDDSGDNDDAVDNEDDGDVVDEKDDIINSADNRNSRTRDENCDTVDKNEIDSNDDEKNEMEQLENAENLKLSLEKKSNDLFMDFDALSFVFEKEESEKYRTKGERTPGNADCQFILSTAGDTLSDPTYPQIYNSTLTLKLDAPVSSSSSSIFKTSFDNFPHENLSTRWQNNLLLPRIYNDVASANVQGKVSTNYFMGSNTSTLSRINTGIIVGRSDVASKSKLEDVTTRALGEFENHPSNKVNLSDLIHLKNQAHQPLELAKTTEIDTNLKCNITSTNNFLGNNVVIKETTSPNEVTCVNPNGRIWKNDLKITLDTREMEISQLKFDRHSPKVSNVRQKHFFAPLSSRPRKLLFTIQSAGKEISAVGSKISGEISGDEIDQTFLAKSKSQFSKKSISDHKNRSDILDKPKSFSSENLFTVDDYKYLKSNNINRVVKSFSCQEFGTDIINSPIFKKIENFNGDLYKKRIIQSEARLNIHPGLSKPFKSEIHVILRCPHKKNLSITEIPENLKLISENYRLSGNTFQEKSRHTIVYEMTPHNTPLSQFNDNQIKQQHTYQATSFESPYPLNLQMPIIMPVEFCTSNQPLTNSIIHGNVPLISKGDFVCCSRQKKEFSYDFVANQLPVYSSTLDPDVALESSQSRKRANMQNNSNSQESGSSFGHSRKKYMKNEKSSHDEKRAAYSAVQRKKDRLKKQFSTLTFDEPESPNLKKNSRMSQENTIAEINSEVCEGKIVSRSSLSGLDSPKKEQSHRMSIFFNSKRRASLTSMKSARSTNIDNLNIRKIPQKNNLDVNTGKLVRATENSVSSREISSVKGRKTSTASGSGSVPWCACWGNGCI